MNKNYYIKQNTINRHKLTNKRIDKIMEILKKSNISSDNYKSNLQPFFVKNSYTNFYKDKKIILNMPEKLNTNIKLIYFLLGNPNKEIYLGEWTIFAFNNALDLFRTKCKEGQKDVFDIGFRYLGMGHIELVCCDLKTHLLFYRRDGGSNGYDRENNFKDVINKSTDNYDKFYFSNWFYNIKLD